MDRTATAKITTIYDQELAECSNWMAATLETEEGRLLHNLIEQIISALEERKTEGKWEGIASRAVGGFARLGYLAATVSLSNSLDSEE